MIKNERVQSGLHQLTVLDPDPIYRLL